MILMGQQHNKVVVISETQFKTLKPINEIKDIAQHSNITVSSLSDFKNILSKLRIDDTNVEDYIGKYCFIEIGSGLGRLSAELTHVPSIYDNNGNAYDGKRFYEEGQWGFKTEHPNVLKLEFDDNQAFDNKMPNKQGFDGKTPATAVKLSAKENVYNKEGFTFYYEGGKDFTKEMGLRLQKFVNDNLRLNPGVKFIIHCMQGKSRSAAIGSYVAKKINQFNDQFLSEYDSDGQSQFNIGMSRKKQPKYPHKNVLTQMGDIEGWNKKNDPTKNQWFYDTLINHPETGYEAHKAKELNEDVFVNDLNQKKKTANLTYKKSSGGRNMGNKNSLDFIKTDKMDANNGDTYEVPLKGGIMSYNITSINGLETMHYFKRIFDGHKTSMKFGQEEYELEMQNSEFRDFMTQFTSKVENVVQWKINEIKNENPDITFSHISIYPVPSSSNFNKEMAKRLQFGSICGLKPNVINSEILKKDTSNLQRDDDFINKNKNYYDSERSHLDRVQGTHINAVDNAINQLSSLPDVDNAINKANACVKKLLLLYYGRNKNGQFTQRYLEKLNDAFVNYQNAVQEIEQSAYFFDVVANKTHNTQLKKVAKQIRYTKGPSVEERTGEIYQILKQYKYLKGIYRNNIKDVCTWEPIKFQIKNLGNDVRMALMNYFKSDENSEMVQKEVEKTKGSIVIIFDDNVSGGATLSDICVQLEKLGMEYLVPITFGKMREKWNIGPNMPITAPENGTFNF